jgi:hypothetical protein
MAMARPCRVEPANMGYTSHLSGLIMPDRFGGAMPDTVGLRCYAGTR